MADTSASQFMRRTPRSGLDVVRALLAPTRIHRRDLAANGGLEHSDVAVGIAGDVGCHVANRPTRQERWLPSLVVGEIVQGGDHGAVGSCRPGEVAIEVVHRVLTVYGTPSERGNLADMQLAMVGLGRMGANMVRRLQRAGHDCVAYDVNPAAVQASVADGARGAHSPQEVVDALTAPRQVWLMVPAAYVGSTIDAFAPLLSPVTR